MPDNQMKAICCTIPLIQDLTHLKLENNNINDFMAAAIMISCFMSPSLQGLEFRGNFLRSSASNTIFQLMKDQPNVIQEFRVPGSMHVGEYLDFPTKDMYKLGNLHSLDFSNIPISIQAAKNIGHYMVFSKKLRFLDVSGCKLAYQGTRYLVDGLNRN